MASLLLVTMHHCVLAFVSRRQVDVLICSITLCFKNLVNSKDFMGHNLYFGAFTLTNFHENGDHIFFNATRAKIEQRLRNVHC